jgi:hypothetical protein
MKNDDKFSKIVTGRVYWPLDSTEELFLAPGKKKVGSLWCNS